MWGSLWYIWMLVLAQYSRLWAEARSDTDLSLYDAYWFAYISTTTVGLGDFYPAPEVLFFKDLLAFSFIFLTGFVLLSAFLGQFGGWLGEYFPDVGGKLTKKLKKAEGIRIELIVLNR
jgi:hypothetical protein